MNKTFEIVNAGYYVSKDAYSGPQSPLRTVIYHELEMYLTDGNISVINNVQHKQHKGNILAAKPGDRRTASVRSRVITFVLPVPTRKLFRHSIHFRPYFHRRT